MLELSESNGVSVKYGFILGLKELLLLNAISQIITNKKEKSNNKQKEKKNQNQANRKVDLDLDVPRGQRLSISIKDWVV